MDSNHGVVQDENQQSIEAKRKNAIKGAFFSEFIDMFDIYLPVVVLTPVLFFFQPAHLSEGLEAILAIPSLNCEIPLESIYKRVAFGHQHSGDLED